MNPQNSTLVQALLLDLSNAAGGWYNAILPYAQAIFFTLVGFQLLWSSINFALGKRQGDEFISMLFIMVIDVGFFYALMLHPDWILDVINSFRVIGRQAGALQRLSPDAVADTGLRLAGAILSTVSTAGLFEFAVAVLVSAFIAIAVLASFAFIAARMVLILAEIFFAVNISPMLLAFSGLSATKYIATQYIGYVIGSGIQLLVMYLLIGSGLDIATSWADMVYQYGASDVSAFMLVGLASALYAVLVWNLPKIIGGLASGAPQMSSGGIAAAAAGFAGGISGARSFARAAVNSGQSFADTARAASANYSARGDAGQTFVKAAARTALTATAATAASGVNSLLGRSGHRNSAERIWTSTANLRAQTDSTNSGSQADQGTGTEKTTADTGTTGQKVA